MRATYAHAIILIILFVAACQTNSAGATTTSPAVAGPAKLETNFAAYAVRDDLALSAIKILSHYLVAVNANDRDRLQKLLAPDFTHVIAVDNKMQISLSRQDFIDIYGTKRNPVTGFYIKDLEKTGPEEYKAVVKQEEVGQYFSSNSIETFGISTQVNAIISRMTSGLFPDHYPEGAAQIFLRKQGAFEGNFAEDWREKIAKIGPDNAINEFRERESSGVDRDEVPHSVLMVLEKPIKSGSTILIEHQFFLTEERQWLRTFEFLYKISDPGEYQVIETISRAGGPRPRTITYRLYVDGRKITERTVPTY